MMLILKYENQEIDISDCREVKLFNQKTGQWEFGGGEIKNTTEKEIYGQKAPAVDKQELIKYKKIIGRPTDLEDIEMI